MLKNIILLYNVIRIRMFFSLIALRKYTEVIVV